MIKKLLTSLLAISLLANLAFGIYSGILTRELKQLKQLNLDINKTNFQIGLKEREIKTLKAELKLAELEKSNAGSQAFNYLAGYTEALQSYTEFLQNLLKTNDLIYPEFIYQTIESKGD